MLETPLYALYVALYAALIGLGVCKVMGGNTRPPAVSEDFIKAMVEPPTWEKFQRFIVSERLSITHSP